MSSDILPSGLKEVYDIDGASVRIYYLECLAHASYILHHDNNAFIVDPRRDVDAYLQELESNGLTLKGILETHVHADFVSGHKELHDRSKTPVYMGLGSADRCLFQPYETKDNELIDMSDKFAIQAVHTPGHTLESVTWILIDKEDKDKPKAAFTGDTLFIGSCGRPDLVGSIGRTSEEMAGLMFDSLNRKLKTLPDEVKVFPAHGAGSPCGKSLSSALFSTIGVEKKTNPTLQFQEKESFVKYLTEGQPIAPEYFAFDVAQNLKGAVPLCEVLKGVKWLNAKDFERCLTKDVCLLDSRRIDDYNSGHIRGSLCFPAGQAGGAVVTAEEGNFAIWVGTLVPPDSRLAVVAYPEQAFETIQRLARIGYKVEMALEGGIDAWREHHICLETSQRVKLQTKENYEALLRDEGVILDVRTPSEYQQNHVKSAVNIPLGELKKSFLLLDGKKKYYAYCSSGYRSVIAMSLMLSGGFNAHDIVNGFSGISADLPDITTSGKICPMMKKKLEENNAE